VHPKLENMNVYEERYCELENKVTFRQHLFRQRQRLDFWCLCGHWLHNLAPQLVRVCAIISGLFFAKLTIAIYLIAWLMFDNPNPQVSSFRVDDEAGDTKS